MITFITFYQTLSRNTCENINEAYKELCDQEYSPIEKPQAVISAMFASARKHHPNARFILVTDESTKVTLPSFIEIVRTASSDECFEIERFLRMIFVAHSLPPNTHVILLDPDIIITGNLEHLFEQSADLFFTYQKHGTKENILKPSQELVFPINIGFIAIRNENRKKALALFRSIIEKGKEIESKIYTYWFVIQELLSNIFKSKLLEMEEKGKQQPYELMAGECKLSFLDAETYNFTPNEYLYIPIDANVVHFKGLKKKKLMLRYWEQIKDESL